MRYPWLRLSVAGVAIAVMLGAAALGLTFPTKMIGVAAWSGVVFAVLYGYGAAVARWAALDLATAERLVVGTVVWVAAGGILLALGVASRGPLLVLAAGGLILCALAFVAKARAPLAPAEVDDSRSARYALGIALSLLLFANMLGMAGTRANPFDDQVSYTAFVKRLLDCGNLIEPFSFRRLSAYGGQTMLHALAALRGDVASIDLMDRGIFQWIAVLLTLDIAKRRRIHLAVTVVLIAFLLCLWDLALNSAGLWTGYTCFLAAYSFASRDDLAPKTSVLLTFAVSAAACTLRQNYLLPAGLFAALILFFHVRTAAKQYMWREAIKLERRTILLSIAITLIVLVPYMLDGWRSSHTFLYPVIPGVANPVTPLRPTAGTVIDELVFFANVIFASEPIRVWWLLFPLMLIARDKRDRRPWPAFMIASAAGFVFLIHSFMLSDQYNLWRYAFGYLTPLAIVFAIEAAGQKPFTSTTTEAPLRMSMVSGFLVWLAIIIQLIIAKDWPAKRFQNSVQNIRALRTLETAKYDERHETLREMQLSVPAGESLALMIDDPYLLDFARNRIFCLDLPGFAAPAPGLPSFTTPEHWRAYFRSQGIRYIAFAETGYGTWLYRRSGWLWRMYSDDELYRFIGAHMVDAIDTLEELAKTSRVLFHADGIYAIDLGEAKPVEPSRGPGEMQRMYRYIRDVSENELHSKAWQLASRGDVVFKPDGAGPSDIVPLPHLEDEPDRSFSLLGLIFGTPQPGSEPAYRWLIDRTLVRVHGEGQHHLHMKVWVKQQRLYSRPIVAVSLDGKRLTKAYPDADGNVVFDVPATCNGWCDLYLTLSTMSEWWLSADSIRAAKLLEFEWTPSK
jgi:hypothetical protein